MFFKSDLMMELQQIGGAPRPDVQKLLDADVDLVPISIDAGSRARFRKLMDTAPPTPLDEPGSFDGHTNFFAATTWRPSPISTSTGPSAGFPRWPRSPNASPCCDRRRPENHSPIILLFRIVNAWFIR